MKTFVCAEADWDDVVSGVGLLRGHDDPRISAGQAAGILTDALLAGDVDTEIATGSHTITLAERFTQGGRRPGGFGWSLGVLLRGVSGIAKQSASPQTTEAARILPTITHVVADNLTRA
jgi:hypothetical protein